MDREYDFTETEAELLNRFGRTCKESARYYRYDVRYKMEYISELVNDLKAGN
jgi:hypothetical protein